MKIVKILFLGIVLVLFNLTYLVAELPDTIRVNTTPGKPGGTLKMSVDISLTSSSLGGLIVIIQGVPANLDTTAGAWYTWSEALGDPLSQSATAALVKYEEGVLNVSIVGVNMDQLAQFGVIPSPVAGELISFTFNVPADMEEATHQLEAVAEGNILMPWPITDPALTEYPVMEVQDIMIANIPEYNALQMVASLQALSGGTLLLPVKVENRDVIGSGSFTLEGQLDLLNLQEVTAGARGAGMAFSATDLEDIGGGLSKSTVSFSGGSIAAGGLGDLCVLNCALGAISSGTELTVTLDNVALNDATGAALADVQAPTVAMTTLEFYFADTLFVDVTSGAHQPDVADEGSGISVIENGQLRLPIRLKNATPVSVLRFYIQEDADLADVLSLNEIEKGDRAGSMIIASADSGGYVQVIGYAGSFDQPMAAGNDVILTLVYDITVDEGDLPLDVPLTLKGVELLDNAGGALGVETVDGTPTIDYRVPNAGENAGPGAALPKAFALTQNHPNPFNPSTTINYQVPDNIGSVSFTLNVYSIRGKLVKTLADGVKGPGFYSAFWNGTDNNGQQVSSGVYFYRFSSKKYTQTRKMILLK